MGKTEQIGNLLKIYLLALSIVLTQFICCLDCACYPEERNEGNEVKTTGSEGRDFPSRGG